jgi:uncharacterized membrane protein YiaA
MKQLIVTQFNTMALALAVPDSIERIEEQQRKLIGSLVKSLVAAGMMRVGYYDLTLESVTASRRSKQVDWETMIV